MSPIENLDKILSLLSVPRFGLNWVDTLIIIIVLIYVVEGYGLGFLRSLMDFITFVGSFVLGLTFYSFFAKILVKNISIPQGFANAAGFFIASFIAEIILALIFRKFLIFVNTTIKFEDRPKIFKTLNKFLGVVPGFLSAVVLLSFILTMIISLPLSPFLKVSVSDSRFGSSLVSNTLGLEKDLNLVFGQAVSDALTFLTVEPKGDESVSLNFKTSKISVDYRAEKQMLAMVNDERVKRKIKPLIWDEDLAKVGRAHCIDMFKRGYFSHYTPEGLSPFDRMGQADISFTFAGENLALAPNVVLAMQGLMASPGHKENILSANFGKLGVGVIDGGIYGEMFCQEFTN